MLYKSNCKNTSTACSRKSNMFKVISLITLKYSSIKNTDIQHIMLKPSEKIWDRERQRRNQKLARAASVPGASLQDKVVSAEMAVRMHEAVIGPGDRVELKRSASHLFLSNHATSPTHFISLRPSVFCQQRTVK